MRGFVSTLKTRTLIAFVAVQGGYLMKRGAISIALVAIAIIACQSQSALVTQNEDKLAAAGFVVRPANTPERISMLNRLPPHQVVQRVSGRLRHHYCEYIDKENHY